MTECGDQRIAEMGERCGTATGATRHAVRGEKPCDACRAAKSEYDRRWRAAGDNTRKNRLSAQAQTRALRALKDSHPDEYRDLYVAAKNELFTAAGLSTPPAAGGA